MKADKRIPQGSPRLIPRSEWCPVCEIQGHDPVVLRHPTMERAFQEIIRQHRPRHRVALLSLCTTTRPYSLGRKWSTLRRIFGGAADLIIASSGGIIPIEFEGCFPYLNYDGHGEAKYDAEYIEVMIRRMKEFFTAHRYPYVLFLFRHKLRNTKAAAVVGPWLVEQGLAKSYAILPRPEHYAQGQAEKFHLRGYKMFPELYPAMLNPAIRQVKAWIKEP